AGSGVKFSSPRCTHCVMGLCLAAAAWISPVAAQVNYGMLTGAVEDANGGVVAGAVVRVTNAGTGQSRQALTAGTGMFSLPDLLPGTYEVQISSPGFRTFLQTGVAINVNSV